MSEPVHAPLQPARDDRSRMEGSRSGSTRTLLLMLALGAGWFLLIRRFGNGDVYAAIGPYALVAAVVSLVLRPREVLGWLRPNMRAVAIGVAVGGAMTALTYPMFRLVAGLYPGFDRYVQALYGGAHSTTLPEALAWVTVIIFAEEVLYRGVLWAELSAWLPAPAAGLVSLVVYTLAQAGTGAWLVALIAAVCGGIWTLQRWYTGSLLSPLLSHLIWTPTVILLWPVT